MSTHPYFPRHSRLGKGLSAFGGPFYDPLRDLGVKTATKPGGPLYDPVRDSILKAPKVPASPTVKTPSAGAPGSAGGPGSTVLAGDSDPWAAR